MPEVERVNPYGDGRRKAEQVQAMFDAIAPAYDFMNRAMTLGLDRLWPLPNRRMWWILQQAPAMWLSPWHGACTTAALQA